MTIKMTGKVEKIYEKGGRCPFAHNIVVTELPETKYPNVIDWSTRNEVGCAVGDEVEISGFLNGRKWTNPDGDEKYFMDCVVGTLTVTKKGEAAATTSNGDTALAAWLKNEGISAADWKAKAKTDRKPILAAFAEYCKAKVAKASSKDFTADDWLKIEDSLAPLPSMEDDSDNEMPF